MACIAFVRGASFLTGAALLLLLCYPNGSTSLPVKRPHGGGISAVEERGGTTGDNNPFMQPGIADFMKKFDIQATHGSGVYVDLGKEKTVDGKVYREPSGRCPVFGKYIETYQPQNDAKYKNDYLDYVPSDSVSRAAGHPLPGGFQNSRVLRDGTKYSPMSKDKLGSLEALTAKTALGKCAQVAYMTTAGRSSSSQYRYPFAFDTMTETCYFLDISMQRLMGERYCSKYGEPAGRTWYCFEPKKNPSKRTHMVYGSAYVGQNPDDWETSCPTKGVKDAVFGVWDGKHCVQHKDDSAAKREKVQSVEECWALAFNNPGVASDHPVTEDEKWGTVGYFFPSTSPNQPHSGGKGVNYASFYPGSNECVLSDKVPTCFEPMAGAVAYTALSGLDLEPVPCLPSFAPQVSVCNFHTCKRSVTSCHDGSLQTLAEDCSLEDTKKCVQEEKPEPNEEKKEEEDRQEGNIALIAGVSVAGAVAILALAGGGFYYVKRRSADAPPREPSRTHFERDQQAVQRRRQRPSDIIQEAEPSFWEEPDLDDKGEDGDTHVLIEGEY